MLRFMRLQEHMLAAECLRQHAYSRTLHSASFAKRAVTLTLAEVQDCVTDYTGPVFGSWA